MYNCTNKILYSAKSCNKRKNDKKPDSEANG